MTRIDLQRAAETLVEAFNDGAFDQLAEVLADSISYNELSTPFRASTRNDCVRRLREVRDRAPGVRGTVQSWTIDEGQGVAVGRLVWGVKDAEDRPVMPGFLELTFDQNNLVTRVRELRTLPGVLSFCPCAEIPPVGPVE